MFGFMRSLITCAALGAALSVVFLTPTGVALGAVNGFLVGICVGLGEWKAQRTERSLATIAVEDPYQFRMSGL